VVLELTHLVTTQACTLADRSGRSLDQPVVSTSLGVDSNFRCNNDLRHFLGIPPRCVEVFPADSICVAHPTGSTVFCPTQYQSNGLLSQGSRVLTNS